MVELTQERLKELLNYNAATGKFTWAVTRRGYAKIGSEAGRVNNKGYREISVDGKRYKAHRLAWLYVHGNWPKDQIDHIDRVRDNNSISNLRDVDQSTNLNNTGPQKNNTSGVKYIHKSGNRWVVSIKGNYSKSFSSIEEAKELLELCLDQVDR